MEDIQKVLDSLQPYLISIRYLDGVPVLDLVLKDEWVIFDEISDIKKVKGGDGKLNYFMIFSENKSINLVNLLAYVDKTIKFNKEREIKHELLKSKINQLKELFKKTPLSKLERLNFTFGEEESFITSMSDIDVPKQIDVEPIEEDAYDEGLQPLSSSLNTTTDEYVNEDGSPIEMSEEDKELALEEVRAERNMKILENRKHTVH